MRYLTWRLAPDSFQCCTAALQVAALTVGQEHNRHFDQMFKVWVNMLVGIIPQNTDIGRAYKGATSAEDQDFVQNLALFLTAFFKVGALATAKHHPTLHMYDKTAHCLYQKPELEPGMHTSQGSPHAEDLTRHCLHQSPEKEDGQSSVDVATRVLESIMLTTPCLQQAHIASLETTDENRAALLVGLDYLLKISFVEDDEVFKICLDYWNYFVPDVYSRCTIMPMLRQHSASATRRAVNVAPRLTWECNTKDV